MVSDEPVIVSTESQNNNQNYSFDSGAERKKKIIFFALLALGIIVLLLVAYLIFKKINTPKSNVVEKPIIVATTPSSTSVLPDFTAPSVSSSTEATSSFSNLVIEYLSFADFYKAPDNAIIPKFSDYKLPMNIKLDVLNYYDLSRKLNLDPGLNDLNRDGFALINNPWEKESPGFYAAYEKLESKQISPLITSDFIIYYYQNILKKAFKDIEENVFYDNLWSINKDLYTAAKNRYEARLAAIGDVNDSVLEGERLEMAFFAVSLQLLRPTETQIAPKGVVEDKNKFLANEADRFYFVPAPYLRDDILREEKLIREANTIAKSPVLLYSQNYHDFIIPSEYNTNAKLSNFYLTTKWLNSVFPLNYRDKNCPTCLLDKEDWRINFIAASFIADDSANLPDLKNKWARIYKLMAFFKGLREDLNYIQYRDSLVSVFGKDYDIAQLFNESNKFAADNFDKLKKQLLTYNLLEIQGAYSQNNPAQRPKMGFKMLAESYWPNNYLFSKITIPNVTTYAATKLPVDNVTSCSTNNEIQRCNGIALDMVNLVSPIVPNNYFLENTSYLNYNREADKLRAELNKNNIWQTTNYWSTLGYIKAFLNAEKNAQPIVTKSSAWQSKALTTAAGAWISMQLPVEKFSVNQIFRGVGLNNASGWSDNAYIEPNLNLINELLANNAMVLKMLTALQIDKEISIVSQGLNSANNNLNVLKKIVIKEIQGEALDQNDKDAIVDFAKQLKIDQTYLTSKQLVMNFPTNKLTLRSDLSKLKLLVLIHQIGDNKYFSVGPVWDYKESR